MIQKTGLRAVKVGKAAKAGDGLRDGAKRAWEAGGRMVGAGLGAFRSHAPVERKSWRDSLGERPGILALTMAGLAIAVAGIALYIRKRRQVSEHYNMGENEGAWEGGSLQGYEAYQAVRG